MNLKSEDIVKLIGTDISTLNDVLSKFNDSAWLFQLMNIKSVTIESKLNFESEDEKTEIHYPEMLIIKHKDKPKKH